MPWTCTAGSEKDLRKAAKEIFAKLSKQWLEYPDYWHLGHSFDCNPRSWTTFQRWRIMPRSKALQPPPREPAD
jgi:hypothetical protein